MPDTKAFKIYLLAGVKNPERKKRGSFIRLTVIDDYVSRDPDLYLFEDVDRLERDTTAELLFAWKPTQLNALFVGAKTAAVDSDALDNAELEDMAFYIKYKRAFRF